MGHLALPQLIVWGHLRIKDTFDVSKVSLIQRFQWRR